MSRSQLPANVVLKITYRQQAAPRGRRRQRGRGLFSFIKKAAKHPAVRSLAKQGLKHLPGLYNAAIGHSTIGQHNLYNQPLQSDSTITIFTIFTIGHSTVCEISLYMKFS